MLRLIFLAYALGLMFDPIHTIAFTVVMQAEVFTFVQGLIQ